MPSKPSILYITDLYYQAQHRIYYEEDLYITSRLKDEFDLLICHPLHSRQFEQQVDLVVIRNSGPVIYYKQQFDEFVKRTAGNSMPTFNSLDGKADIRGKDYLVRLTEAGFPVIPTIEGRNNLSLLPQADHYLLKLKEGADSIGQQKVSKEELADHDLNGKIVQPLVDFKYEVSFYYINSDFQYALYAPDRDKRWQLKEYNADERDLKFAGKFIQWNNISNGIQRVDAIRTQDESLLLMELEDINPFLSIDLLKDSTREIFLENFKRALIEAITLRDTKDPGVSPR